MITDKNHILASDRLLMAFAYLLATGLVFGVVANSGAHMGCSDCKFFSSLSDLEAKSVCSQFEFPGLFLVENESVRFHIFPSQILIEFTPIRAERAITGQSSRGPPAPFVYRQIV